MRVLELYLELSLDLLNQSFDQEFSFFKWPEVDINHFCVEAVLETDDNLNVGLQIFFLNRDVPVEVVNHCTLIDILLFLVGSL